MDFKNASELLALCTQQQLPISRSCAAASASWAKPRVMRSRTV